ncbi:ABC transporter permease [Lentibacillus cibarius]|uniref:ABC transporter permease n=1 Tax=Lentibacillus cibarius TaxID=2583219 RepID=A0A549YFD0_9BACI|nr:ABC transporter permease [Lentibacillus cibarius]TRM10591.1 ABC transporter permease [Lentibacillus cibarius]
MSGLWDFFINYQDDLISGAIEHVQLVGLAVLIAIAFGVPLSIYLTTNDALASVVLQLASIMMTIPSIALFGVMMPILSVIGQGIGFVPAVIALFLYSQLPIIRNTYVAIKNVDPEMRDAANGIGMKTWQRLRKVEIPNALPLIMAGIRTAIVLNIGIAALATFIGAGGLGYLIDKGIGRTNTEMIIGASIAISIFAITVDIMLGFLQRWMTPKGLKALNKGSEAKQ